MESQQMCPICRDPLLPTGDIGDIGDPGDIKETDTIKTPCNHSFHTQCLNVWLRRSSTCPCCRGVISSIPLEHFSDSDSDDSDSDDSDEDEKWNGMDGIESDSNHSDDYIYGRHTESDTFDMLFYIEDFNFTVGCMAWDSKLPTEAQIRTAVAECISYNFNQPYFSHRNRHSLCETLEEKLKYMSQYYERLNIKNIHPYLN